MTPKQREVMDVLADRKQRSKSLTALGVANETGMKLSTVERIMRVLRAKGHLERVGEEHALLRQGKIAGTYRRVAEDGIEVTQCPPGYARGYGFDEGDARI